MEIPRVVELLGMFRKKRILVIGDVMLDEFIWGKVSRISPEAPVPVVEVTNETAYPGGAANVARNLKEFCEEAYVLGIVGNDRHGNQLKQIMSDLGLNLRCLFDDEHFQTIVKTRIVARQQQMVRVDREQLSAPPQSLLDAALLSLQKILPKIDAVIFEDYAKGFLSEEFVASATQLILQAGKMVTADPNPKNPIHWRGLTAIKPNRHEAFHCAGVVENDPAEDFTLHSRLPEVSRRLLEKWQTRYLLVTLGEHGMVLFERESLPFHIPTRAQEVYDVSGAGDTAIALFTLALASGATPREAAEISNQASSIVVGKLGTATLTPAELRSSFERPLPASLEARELAVVRTESEAGDRAALESAFEERQESPTIVHNSRNITPDRIVYVEVPARTRRRRKIVRTGASYEFSEKSLQIAQGLEPLAVADRRPDFATPRPAVFLDRDGTLMEEVGYCSREEDVKAFSNVPVSLYRLRHAGFLLVILSNQSGIGRGLFKEHDFAGVHGEFLRQIGPQSVDATYFCPDHPEHATARRKPGIGMIEEADRDWHIDLAHSWFIGDKADDIACGQAAGLRTILVATGHGKEQVCKPDHRAADIAAAVDWIVVS